MNTQAQNVIHLPVAELPEPGVDKHAIAEILDVSVSWVEKRCIAKQDRIPSYKDKAGRRRFRPSVCLRWFNQDGEG